ncbi:anti-sigma factor family protein [Microvirga roseola]|uniref:anti-sigma factor family protein n=1 Tax=Microvirga roseola TaxID=2883126 RepID=UPI001E374E0A|nr:anti-sigma factor [Microvirga roseola]
MTGERPIGEDDLQAFIDGRLALGRLEKVKAYLVGNPEAAARAQREIEQREALRARLAFKAQEPIPARLRIANLTATHRRRQFLRPAMVAASLAWLALGIAVGAVGGAWWADGSGVPSAQVASVAGDAIAAHRIYVGEKLHPVEVAADQEAHLVQWLSRRVGKPLAAPDLTARGYRLMGGRLLPAGAEPAALFMYEDASGSRLTLYARTGGREDETSFRFETQDGVSAFSWIDNGLSYVVTARTDRDRLLPVAETIYRQFDNQPGAVGGRL